MDITMKVKVRLEHKINITLPALLPNNVKDNSRGPVTSSDENGQVNSCSRNKRAIPLLAIAQGTTAIGGMLIKGINTSVDAKRASSFNNTIKMLNTNVEITHNRLVTLENRISMMAKAIKKYLTIQVGTLQRILRQYIRYESALDDTLIGIENLNSGYLTHILDPQVLPRYLEIIEDDLEEMAPEYEPVFTSVYQYYGNSLASFTNTIDDLLLQLPN